jgi:hypothetical protein
MTVWAAASLLLPGQLSIPITLQNLARLLVDKSVRDKEALLTAIRRDPTFFNPPVTTFINSWWTKGPIIPSTITIDELAAAWKEQRDAFDQGFSRYRSLELEKRIQDINKTFLREACSVTRQCITLLNEQMKGSHQTIERMGGIIGSLDTLIDQ